MKTLLITTFLFVVVACNKKIEEQPVNIVQRDLSLCCYMEGLTITIDIKKDVDCSTFSQNSQIHKLSDTMRNEIFSLVTKEEARVIGHETEAIIDMSGGDINNVVYQIDGVTYLLALDLVNNPKIYNLLVSLDQTK